MHGCVHLFVESVHKSWGILFLHIKFLDLVTDVLKKQTNKPLYFMLAMSRLLLRTLTRFSNVEPPSSCAETDPALIQRKVRHYSL